MWNKPSLKELLTMPKLYETENVPIEEKIIHQHYYFGANDWYMAEYCPENKLFFGYAILNGDLVNSEWGYVGFDELDDIKVRGFEVDRDLFWRPKRFGEIERVRMNFDESR